MSLEQFARLTDRQIAELYGHPREKNGTLKRPRQKLKPKQAAPTLAVALMEAEQACQMFQVPMAERDALYDHIRASYGGTTDGAK